MKPNQRITLTKRLLCETLLRLLDKKPLDKISVSELCRESGINRATFYRHYDTTRDVLLDMELEFTKKLYSDFYVTAPDCIPDSLAALCQYLYDNSSIIKIFIRNNSEEDLTLLINNMFRSFIEDKSNAISLPPGFEKEDLKLITTCIAGGGYFMLRQWLLDDIEKTPGEISELVLSFISHTSSILDSPSQST